MVEVTCDDNEGWMFCLKWHGHSVDDVTHGFGVARWWSVDSYGNDTCKLLWQIMWTKSDGEELDVYVMLQKHGNVPEVTPPVVHERDEPSSFLLAASGVEV